MLLKGHFWKNISFFQESLAIAKHLSTSQAHFQHIEHHFHLVSVRGVHEGFQIARALDVLSAIGAMGVCEQLELAVNGVDIPHWAFGVLQAFHLRRRIYLPRYSQRLLNGAMGRFAIVMEGSRILHVRHNGPWLPGFRRVPVALVNENGAFAVRGAIDAMPAPRKAAHPFPIPVEDRAIRLVAQEAFVDADIPIEPNVLRIVLQDQKYLPKPISACIVGVSVVQGGAEDALMLEETDEEFRPFRDGDLVGIEWRPGQRIEFVPATQAKIGLDSVLSFPVAYDVLGATARAGLNGEGIG